MTAHNNSPYGITFLNIVALKYFVSFGTDPNQKLYKVQLHILFHIYWSLSQK
jgi:hypothetical protein